MTPNNLVEAGAAEVFKAAILKTDVLTMPYFYSGIGASEPPLVVKLMIVGTVNLRPQLIGFHEIHACLQGHVALF